MDLSRILRCYVDKMLKEIAGMKVLVMDNETAQAVSMVYSQSEILEQEVFLVEKLETQSIERLLHLKAVYFLRPTRENVARLRKELRDPRFGEYNFFFANRIDDLRLQDLAEMDKRELVMQVQEFFGDFEVIDQHHFAINIPRAHVTMQPVNWEYANSMEAITRLTEGLASLTLSLRRRFTIRYQAASEICHKLALAMNQLTNSEERELFDFGNRAAETAPVLLLVDRREDPVTPLLTQWTYQAMVHELLGIQANRVTLPQSASVKKGFQELVLSARQDDFYKKHMYNNFGDIGTAVKDLVDEFQRHSAKGKSMESLEEMQSFVENYSEFSAAQRNASKHVTLISTLSTVVDSRSLMQVSSAEQEVSCSGSSPQGHCDMVRQLLSDPSLTDNDRIRLLLLYALRYERDGRSQLGSLLSLLQDLGLQSAQLGLLKTLLLHAGSDKRVGDLYSSRSFTSRFATMAKQNLRGVENVYTQHTPLLVNTLEMLLKGRLKETEYASSAASPSGSSGPTKPPKLVVIFIIGGTTYEEAKAVADLNVQGERGEGWAAGARFLLGGSGVLNSQSFLQMLLQLQAHERFQ